MSHRVRIYMISDQEIEICGEPVNVHDIESILVDGNGVIKSWSKISEQDLNLKSGEPSTRGPSIAGSGFNPN